MKKGIVLFLLFTSVMVLSGCTDADVASQNISKEADFFNINRRIVFYNGINWEYMLTIEWFCSLGNNDPTKQLSVICKIWKNNYKKHFLGLSDNVTYFVEQVENANVSSNYYKVVFKPSVIIPDVSIR